jgi:putative transposase
MSGRCGSCVMRSACRRPASTHGDRGRKVRARSPIEIRRVHADHRGRYGAPRIHAELRAEGQSVSRKRVERVMRRHGIQAHAPRRYRVCTTDSKHALPIAANLLDRNFAAEKPDQVWLADITPAFAGAGSTSRLARAGSIWP